VVDKLNLTDGRITLKPLCLGDAELLYRAVSESALELMPWLSFVHPDYSIEETRQWLAKRDEEWKNGVEYDFAIIDCASGVFLGGCGLNHIINEFKMANAGYWVRTSQTRKGVAPAAMLLLARFAFDVLGFNRVEIMTDVENKNSQRVAGKVGAKKEGTLRNRICTRGDARDVHMFSLVPEDLKK